MATYIYDPSEQTTGIDPTGVGNGWTMRDGSVSVSEIEADATNPVGAKVWRADWSFDYNKCLWDGVPQATTDMEVLSLWKNSNNDSAMGNIHRLNESGNFSMYYWGFRNNTTQVRGRKWDDGSRSDLSAANHGLTRDNTKWYWVKSQSIGTAHKVKAWEYDTAEPDWQIEQTDDSVASGGVGVGDYQGRTTYLAWYSVGTGGDAAPLPGVTAGLQFASNSFLDGGLNRLVNNAERIAILSAYTLADSYAVVTGNILAAATTGTITLSSSGSDRVATSPVVSGTATAAGDADHLAILDDTNSEVLWVTEETSKATIASGNTVNFPALTYTSKQPIAVAIKFASSGVLDGGLDYISANAERIVLLSAYTNGNSYAVVTGNILAAATVTSANFTISSSGTDRQIASDAGILGTGSAAGTATHIAFLNDTGTEVLWVTAEDASLVVAVSDSVSFPALTYTAPQPEAAA